MQIFVDADAVDYKLISICHKGDVVVFQDYSVAAMALISAIDKIFTAGDDFCAYQYTPYGADSRAFHYDPYGLYYRKSRYCKG